MIMMVLEGVINECKEIILPFAFLSSSLLAVRCGQERKTHCKKFMDSCCQLIGQAESYSKLLTRLV